MDSEMQHFGLLDGPMLSHCGTRCRRAAINPRIGLSAEVGLVGEVEVGPQGVNDTRNVGPTRMGFGTWSPRAIIR